MKETFGRHQEKLWTVVWSCGTLDIFLTNCPPSHLGISFFSFLFFSFFLTSLNLALGDYLAAIPMAHLTENLVQLQAGKS